MVGTFLEPSCGRENQPIHSIPYSVAQPLERGSNNYYSIIQEVFKINELQSCGPDWWTLGATILSGIITALATMGAVIYTNRKSNAQLKKQEEKYALERKEQFQQSKYVVLKPTLLLMPLLGLLDRLIVQNDYNRVILWRRWF